MEASQLNRQENRHYGRSNDGQSGSRRQDDSREHRVHFGAAGEDEDSHSFLSHVFGILTGMVSFVCLCGLLTLLFILYFTVRPFSVSAYRRLSAQLGLACILDAMALLLPSNRIYLTEDSDIPSPVGTSVLVSNHLCDADWWVLFMLGRSVGLQGTMKAFLRNEYLHVNVANYQTEQTITMPSANVVPPTSSPRMGSINRNGEHIHTGQRISHTSRTQASPDLSLAAKLLHLLLDFPLVNGEDYIADREHLFRLLRSFAPPGGVGAPVHFVSFPEGWCLHSGENRQSILAKSNEFAQKEGRHQLKHLLLPRTRGFNASLECLRESNPVVYDVTMAYAGYDGSLPRSEPLSLTTLWDILRRKLPSEIYVRVKRFSFEEVLQDSLWLDKTWQEKDRLLNHFARRGNFPTDNRSYRRHHVFNTWSHSVENSIAALARLLMLPCIVPVLFLLSIPIFWTLLIIWVLSSIMRRIFPGYEFSALSGELNETSDGNVQSQTPGSEASSRTPFVPATPFASPTAHSFFSKRD